MQNNFDQEILDPANLNNGLTDDQVQDRINRGLDNEPVDSNIKLQDKRRNRRNSRFSH